MGRSAPPCWPSGARGLRGVAGAHRGRYFFFFCFALCEAVRGRPSRKGPAAASRLTGGASRDGQGIVPPDRKGVARCGRSPHVVAIETLRPQRRTAGRAHARRRLSRPWTRPLGRWFPGGGGGTKLGVGGDRAANEIGMGLGLRLGLIRGTVQQMVPRSARVTLKRSSRSSLAWSIGAAYGLMAALPPSCGPGPGANLSRIPDGGNADFAVTPPNRRPRPGAVDCVYGAATEATSRTVSGRDSHGRTGSDGAFRPHCVGPGPGGTRFGPQWGDNPYGSTHPKSAKRFASSA